MLPIETLAERHAAENQMLKWVEAVERRRKLEAIRTLKGDE